MTEPSIRSQTPRLPPPTSHGRMTALMRAVSAASAPRVLRVGVVRGGRVVEERILAGTGTITLGRDEGATFVVPDAHAPSRTTVLEHARGGYFLSVHAPLTGRVALDDGVHDLAALRPRGKVRLGESARGRIVLGATTLLFQFVPTPPISPRFRLCYNRGLLTDPGMAGSVLLRAKIAPNGEVTRVDAAQVSGLSGEVAGCIAKVVRDAQFDAPGSSGSTLDIPVKVTQQTR